MVDLWESVWEEWECLRRGGDDEGGDEGCTHKQTHTDTAKGDMVCMDCGKILDSVLHDEYGRTMPLHNIKPASMYKRKHHWNERISQWLVGVRRVPDDVIAKVKRTILHSNVNLPSLTKTDIRKVLRSLHLQKHIEHWVEIYCMVKETPFPVCDSEKVEEIREQFLAIECAFMKHQPTGRKCMINYNYLFNRLLELHHLEEHQCWFPNLKSKSKLRTLDKIWEDISGTLGMSNTLSMEDFPNRLR